MAIGLLMAQYSLTEEAAFAVLRRHSSHTDAPVREVAARIVTEGSAAGVMLGTSVAAADQRGRPTHP